MIVILTLASSRSAARTFISNLENIGISFSLIFIYKKEINGLDLYE